MFKCPGVVWGVLKFQIDRYIIVSIRFIGCGCVGEWVCLLGSIGE